MFWLVLVFVRIYFATLTDKDKMTRLNSTWSQSYDRFNISDVLDKANVSTSMNMTNNTIIENGVCGNNDTMTEQLYIIIPILMITSFVAMAVNVVVLVSAYWIRCPMTPNLKISLSLAAADALSSTMYGMPLFISIWRIVEIFRLSGIVITVVNLLALSLNHYIGILKPLHYNSIVTSKKVSAVICLLWIFPFLTITAICLAFDADHTLTENLFTNMDIPPEFMGRFTFRITITSLFFLPIFAMVIFYTHILIVVRKQQSNWNNLSRLGSTRVKGKSSQKINRERKQLESNVRAIYTTLLILGSCFIGWTPALLMYTLTCNTGCYISGQDLTDLNCNHRLLVLILRLVDNILVILKMLANPIIYSIRMREIRDGTHRMFMAIAGLFCESKKNALHSSSYYYRSRIRRNSTGGTTQVRMTSIKNGRNGSQKATSNNANSFL